MGHEKGEKFMSYLNSVTIIGFVGADPEQRQARNNNGSKFTVLSVATQRSWKNTDDEWASKTEWHRVCVFRPRLAEYVATTIKKGAHVLVEGSLVSTSLDLSALSPVRGAESATGTQRRVPVPSSPLALTLTLPLASPEGHYDLNLTSGSETVWTKSAQAHLLKGKTLIQVEADFRQIRTGNYNLEVRSSTGIRLVQPVSIAVALPNSMEQKR